MLHAKAKSTQVTSIHCEVGSPEIGVFFAQNNRTSIYLVAKRARIAAKADPGTGIVNILITYDLGSGIRPRRGFLTETTSESEPREIGQHREIARALPRALVSVVISDLIELAAW